MVHPFHVSANNVASARHRRRINALAPSHERRLNKRMKRNWCLGRNGPGSSQWIQSFARTKIYHHHHHRHFICPMVCTTVCTFTSMQFRRTRSDKNTNSCSKTSLFCKSFPSQPFFFFFRTDYMIAQTFTVTSEHIRFFTF